jgi:hypothetical protein
MGSKGERILVLQDGEYVSAEDCSGCDITRQEGRGVGYHEKLILDCTPKSGQVRKLEETRLIKRSFVEIAGKLLIFIKDASQQLISKIIVSYLTSE